DPDSVEPQVHQFFTGFELGYRSSGEAAGTALPSAAAPSGVDAGLQRRAESLIRAYRDLGHLAAALDPLGTMGSEPADLQLGAHGLSEADLDRLVDVGSISLPNPSPLRAVTGFLRSIYCDRIGVEYAHVQDRTRWEWIRGRVESGSVRPEFTRE